jgi:hypothetical protein
LQLVSCWHSSVNPIESYIIQKGVAPVSAALFCAIWCVIEDFAHAVAWGGATKIAGATACDDFIEIANRYKL